jgi:hypothetical protein
MQYELIDAILVAKQKRSGRSFEEQRVMDSMADWINQNVPLIDVNHVAEAVTAPGDTPNEVAKGTQLLNSSLGSTAPSMDQNYVTRILQPTVEDPDMIKHPWARSIFTCNLSGNAYAWCDFDPKRATTSNLNLPYILAGNGYLKLAGGRVQLVECGIGEMASTSMVEAFIDKHRVSDVSPVSSELTTMLQLVGCCDMGLEGVSLMSIAACSLALSSAKNASWVQGDPPSRNIRRHASKEVGGLQFHHTTIDMSRPKYLGGLRSDSDGAGEIPWHRRRGHWRHVHPSRPLFGRPTVHGWFWLAEQEVGNKDYGRIYKDHTLLPHPPAQQ